MVATNVQSNPGFQAQLCKAEHTCKILTRLAKAFLSTYVCLDIAKSHERGGSQITPGTGTSGNKQPQRFAWVLRPSELKKHAVLQEITFANLTL